MKSQGFVEVNPEGKGSRAAAAVHSWSPAGIYLTDVGTWVDRVYRECAAFPPAHTMPSGRLESREGKTSADYQRKTTSRTSHALLPRGDAPGCIASRGREVRRRPAGAAKQREERLGRRSFGGLRERIRRESHFLLHSCRSPQQTKASECRQGSSSGLFLPDCSHIDWDIQSR